ncbi:MAG: DHA2 family efflux MFS transporter permease subunit, partial [Acidimicrobiales bacterium]
LGQLMVVLDLTVVNIALPKAQIALHFSNDDRQWIITAYALAFGSLLLLGGRLSDRIGRKRTFVIGMTGFALASAVGGAAQSFGMLAGARAVQGVFAALLSPATLSLLTTTFPRPPERGKAFGIFSAIAGSGSAVGLLLGGALTTYMSWRWCLYVNDVIAVAGLIGATVLLGKAESDPRVHIDDPGILLAIAGLVSLVFGFSEAALDGWGAVACVAPLVASGVLLVAFVLAERRAAHPMLPFDVLLDRNRGASYLLILLLAIGMFGVFLFLVYYLEVIARYSAVRAGIAFIPLTVCVVVGSVLTNTRLLPRFGPRALVVVASLFAVGGMLYFAQLTLASSFWSVIFPAELIFGAPLGCMFGICFNMATAGTGPGTAGVASALVTTGQQVGGSVGTSLLNTIATSAAGTYLVTHASAAYLTRHAGAITTTEVWRAAQVHSYDVAFYVGAGIIFLAGLGAAIIYPAGRRRAPAGAHAVARPAPA